ncbi:MAG: hydroxymethylbilane synthase [Verrucomicrobiota bacterium]
MNESTVPIRIGTRGSALALVQASMTEAALDAAFPGLIRERVVITTTGDRRTDVALSQVAKEEGVFDKGVFIKELEQALEDDSIDIAVHSLKDMPSVLDPRFQLGAVLERAPVRDVLITRVPGGLSGLPPGARIGTSSPRRTSQIRWLQPDLHVIDIRGNVPTRLEKLAAGDSYDAILLAEAGLLRLGFLTGDAPAATIAGIPGLFATCFEESQFFPAAGQGAVGLEIRAGDAHTATIAAALNHAATWQRVVAEREFLRLLDAGCHTPVGVCSRIDADGILHLDARVFPETGGGPPRTGRASASDPFHAARALFDSLSD